MSINSLLEVKECPKTTCWKVLVYMMYLMLLVDQIQLFFQNEMDSTT